MIKSDTLAFELFKLSAEGGVVNAQCNLGSHYARGSGVAQSNKYAREWYTKAAKQGDQIAINNLKLMDKQEGRTSVLTTHYSHYVQSNLLCFIIFGSSHTNHTNSNPRG